MRMSANLVAVRRISEQMSQICSQEWWWLVVAVVRMVIAVRMAGMRVKLVLTAFQS
jgi:hypothetical protein